MSGLSRTIPALPVVEIQEAVSFDCDRLGFEQIHTAGSRSRGVDALYDEYRANDVVYNPDTVVGDTWWGTREFPALDLHRNLLTFFEAVRNAR